MRWRLVEVKFPCFRLSDSMLVKTGEAAKQWDLALAWLNSAAVAPRMIAHLKKTLPGSNAHSKARQS